MKYPGAELEVMTDLVLTGALLHVNITMMEWHENLSDDDRKARMKKLHNVVNQLEDISSRIQ